MRKFYFSEPQLAGGITLLTAFEPRLVGSVLSGTATAHSDVELHVFSDSPEAVCIALMDRHVSYETVARRIKIKSKREHITTPGIRFVLDADTVEAVIFPQDSIRQPPVSAVNGKPTTWAKIEKAVSILIPKEHVK